MTEATNIILNPNGNHRRDGRQWIAGQRVCLRELAPAEVTLVESVEEAALAAKQSALKGYQKIVSVGDSATAHGVVNGVMGLAEGHRKRLKVGFLSFSRPDLWSRTLELPRNLARQLEILSAGHTMPFDVGQVDCYDDSGNRIVRYFLNGASFGVTGRITREWHNPESTLFQSLPSILAALSDAVSSDGQRVRLESMGASIYEGKCALGMIMGGRYYHALGRIAPQADPTDGRLELAWLRPESLWGVIPRFAGSWLPPFRGSAPFHWHSLEQVRAISLDGPVYLDLDGQPTGRLPAAFSVLRRALPVMVAPVAVKLKKPRFAPVNKLGNRRLVGNIKSAAGM